MRSILVEHVEAQSKPEIALSFISGPAQAPIQSNPTKKWAERTNFEEHRDVLDII